MTPPAPAATPVPSAAAARSAQQEPVGPVANTLPDKQQTAALPPATKAETPTAEDVAASLSIAFAAGVAELDVGSQGSVKDLAQRMSGDKSLRVQLMAYATDPDKNTSKARRLALDRAIAIRNMLIEAGVERTRIEVRALGDQGEGGNLDRVDAVAIKR
jgi:outer membrane protein OmpA-like peptidoglycan-associated protein